MASCVPASPWPNTKPPTCRWTTSWCVAGSVLGVRMNASTPPIVVGAIVTPRAARAWVSIGAAAASDCSTIFRHPAASGALRFQSGE